MTRLKKGLSLNTFKFDKNTIQQLSALTAIKSDDDIEIHVHILPHWLKILLMFMSNHVIYWELKTIFNFISLIEVRVGRWVSVYFQLDQTLFCSSAPPNGKWLTAGGQITLSSLPTLQSTLPLDYVILIAKTHLSS